MPLRMVVGLGNPGRRYRDTRHNVGFMVAEAALRKWRTGPDREQDEAVVAPARIGAGEAIVVRPLTYMNRSGDAVARLARRHAVPPQEILLVYDDADLPVGRLRIRSGGSAGGHLGVESILESLGSSEIMRLRLGIGKDEEDLSDRVLSPFARQERPAAEAMVARAVEAIEIIASEGVTAAMNRFNRRGASTG